MKAEILKNIDNPSALENLYREDKVAFKKEFNLLYPEINDKAIAGFWNERLNFENPEQNWGVKNELFYIIGAALIAGIIAKLPYFFNISEDFFYPRNLSFIVFPVLTAYFVWKNKLQLKTIIFLTATFLISLVFINLLPDNMESNTLMLSCIHLAFFLWTIMGFAYTGNEYGVHSRRISFLQYNADFLIMSGLILIGGAVLTGITIGLFSLIGYSIEKFYTEWIVVMGLAAVPIFATYLTQTNPQLVNKVSPIIAKIFSPLVLVTLVVYLFAILQSGKDPYNDRDFLINFNLLLIGVMALILFSVAETSMKDGTSFNSIVLLGLSVTTIIVNLIAVSAILFRISEWGITPNRLAVLGSNLLILTNLIFISYHLFRSLIRKGSISKVESSISFFLPIYSLWTVIVVFIFPFIFNFK